MFMKTLTAGVLAVSLSLTMLTAPTQAQASFSEEDAVIGIITLLLIGAAIHNSRDEDDQVDTPPVVSTAWRTLPNKCLHRGVRRNGDIVRFFGEVCMTNSYSHLARLPDRCRVQFHGDRGQHRAGWRARCLHNAGFRFTRH